MTKITILWSFLMLFAPAIAQTDGEIRLRDGTSSAEGRLEIYHDYEWGTICDDYFDMADADVACRQLGFTAAQEVKDRAYFGYADSSTQVWLDNMNCYGTEWALTDCRSNGWGDENCGHNEDVGVICTYYSVQEGSLRLVDGLDLDEGRVEIYHNNIWGTICNDYWGYDEARVACRQLGYNGVTNSKTTIYGPGQDPIHLDNVDCYGYENNLLQCRHSSWGSHNCDHYEDVGINCARSNNNDLPGWAISLIVIGSLMFFVILVVVIGKVCSKPRSKRNASATAVVTTNGTTPMQTYPVTVGSAYPPPNTTYTPSTAPYPQSTAPYPPTAMAFQAYPPTVSGVGALTADGSLPPAYTTLVPGNPTPMSQPDGAGAAYPPTVNVPAPEVKG